MKRIFTVISCIALALVFNLNSFADTPEKDRAVVDQNKVFSFFETVEANNDFNITFQNSDSYSVDWNVNKDLQGFVNIYVRRKTLYLEINREGRRYIRKYYSGRKNPKPTLNVIISLPTIKEINLYDDVTVAEDSEPISGDNIVLNVRDHAKIGMLQFNLGSGEFTANLRRKADVVLKVQAEKININARNSSKLQLTQDAKDLVFNLRGSSNVQSNGSDENVEVNARWSSQLVLTGNVNNLKLKTKGSSLIDASDFSTENANLELNGNEAWVNANNIDVNIKRGAKLVFKGEPKFNIIKVDHSTILRFQDVKKK